MCGMFFIDNEPPDIPGWLRPTQTNLAMKWRERTGHFEGARNNSLACQMAVACRECEEHLSIPCSIASEANDIGTFLDTPFPIYRPDMFLRLLLMLLGEFVGNLKDINERIHLGINFKKPTLEIWVNRWAKHRLTIAIQHHPTMLFADSKGQGWNAFAATLTEKSVLKTDEGALPLLLMDEKWFRANATKTMFSGNVEQANSNVHALVVVPPMMTFIDETVHCFQLFVNAAKSNPHKIRRFEATHRKLCIVNYWE